MFKKLTNLIFGKQLQISPESQELAKRDQTYQQALEAIQRAHQNRHTHLALIPSEKRGDILKLNLQGENITEPLTQLPPEIGQLTQLRSLDISFNQLTQLPPEIGQLTQLRSLDISFNQLTQLPPEIGQFTALQDFNINFNNLTQLPPEIGQLTALQDFNISFNNLTQLPPEIGQLTALQDFNISFNNLTQLPPEIGQLTQLRKLNLRNNQLTALPQELRALRQLTHLLLHDNPDLPLLAEILGKAPHNDWGKPNNPHAILDYYFRTDKIPLHEAKLILVGEGRNGKTSVKRRLLFDTFTEGEPSTLGIEIEVEPWAVTVKTTPFKLNVWDFGGQEIMHATHHFFMTHRSLYLLVLDVTKTVEENRLDYWLNLIATFGENSPVIVAVNQRDKESQDKEPPHLAAFKAMLTHQPLIEISCKTGRGLPELKRLIEQELLHVPDIQTTIPQSWLRLKDSLPSLPQNYLSYDDYLQQCQTAQVVTEDYDQATYLLHHLGALLYYPDDEELKQVVIIKPRWLVQGIYDLINAPQLKNQWHGRLKLGQLAEILDTQSYPPTVHLKLLHIMRRFERCFSPLGEIDRMFIVPDCLPDTPPDLAKLMLMPRPSFVGVKFAYQYRFLPSSILTRLMAQIEVYQDNMWREGFVINQGSHTAIIQQEATRPQLTITIEGAEGIARQTFLTDLKQRLRKLHNEFEGRLHEQETLWVNHQFIASEQLPAKLRDTLQEVSVNTSDDFLELQQVYRKKAAREAYKDMFSLGSMAYSEKQYRKAREHLIIAHQALQDLRGMRHADTAQQQELSAESVKLYQMLVHCCLEYEQRSQNYEESFQYAAIAKGRAFINMLAKARLNFNQVEFKTKLAEADRLHAKTQQATGDTLSESLQQEKDHWDNLEKEFPILCATLAVPELKKQPGQTHHPIIELANHLNATLVEFYCYAHQDLVGFGNLQGLNSEGWCAFVITPNAIQYVPLPDLTHDLITRLMAWVAAIENRLGAGRSTLQLKHLDTLYHAAIQPLRPYLPAPLQENFPPMSGGLRGVAALILAPFGDLHLLPLAAARSPEGRYLAEEYTLSFVPSLTALQVVRQQAQKTPPIDSTVAPLLSVAYPGYGDNYLKNVSQEAQAIAHKFTPSELLNNASVTQLLQACQGRRIVHLSGHGHFDATHPHQSGLQLADDNLTVEQIISQLKLPQAQLVTLAACQSGQMSIEQGDEHIGLLQAMITAGAQTVVASLWRVDDAATSTLFTTFYDNLAQRHSPAQALHLAAQTLRQHSPQRARHPYYWAAFQANGLAYQPLQAQLTPQVPVESTHLLTSSHQVSESQRSYPMDLTELLDHMLILLQALREEHAYLQPKLTEAEQRQVQATLTQVTTAWQAAESDPLKLWDMADQVHRLVEEIPALHELLEVDTNIAAMQQQRQAIRLELLGQPIDPNLPLDPQRLTLNSAKKVAAEIKTTAWRKSKEAVMDNEMHKITETYKQDAIPAEEKKK